MSDITINAQQYRTLVAAGIDVEEFLAGGEGTGPTAPAAEKGDGRNRKARKVRRIPRRWAQIGLGVLIIGAFTIPPAFAGTGTGTYSTIGGGNGNTASATYTTVGGGNANAATNLGATIGGGHSNLGSGVYSTMGGGYDGEASGDYSTVGGGEVNHAQGVHATVAGGWSNYVSGASGTVAGGTANSVDGLNGTVGGGSGNFVNGVFGTIAGGGLNNDNSTAGNRVTDSYGTVGGGGNNQAGNGTTSLIDRIYATVAGGLTNTASGSYAGVAGGRSNTASGSYAMVPGGYANTASGAFSFAAGRQARATTAGSFVWGDNTSANISPTAVNQFIARASGGVKFFSNAAGTTGVVLPAGGGAWSNLSDRNLKANFSDVNGTSILMRVVSLPIQFWNYKSQDPSIRHIGPMAQDFAAAFGVGENNTTISTVDAEGVALAAIQGLYHQNRQLKRDLVRLQGEVDALLGSAH